MRLDWQIRRHLGALSGVFVTPQGYASKNAMTTRGRRGLLLHRLVIGACEGQIVDHINRDRLDNRLSNLRLVSTRQNAWNANLSSRNKSGHRGVYWHPKNKRWIAGSSAAQNGHNRYLGCFKTKEEAIEAVRLFREKQERLIFQKEVP